MDILRRIFGLEPTESSTSPSPMARTAADDPDATKELDDTNDNTAPLGTNPKENSLTDEPKVFELDDEDEEKQQIQTKILAEGRTQKLPDHHSPEGSNGRRIIYGQRTDVGQVRTNNQDALATFLLSSSSADNHPEVGIFIVADGMGGHTDGEKASAVTTRIVTHYLSQAVVLPMLSHEEPSADRPTLSEIMRDAIQGANEVVAREVPEGGTTVTAAAIMGDLLYMAHVGDSRAYVINGEGIEQVTRDHSLVQRFIELEQITVEEAAEHPHRNVLYRALGQKELIEVDTKTRRLTPGAQLLICSDGLWNLVSDDEIRHAVAGSPNPQLACDSLVKLANDRGGSDNITVVIVKLPN